MQIFINTHPSSTLTLTIDPSDTVKHLKDKIKRQYEVSSEQLTLQYCSKLLKDDFPLGIYNIHEGSTLFLTYPILGGMDSNRSVPPNEWAKVLKTASDGEMLKDKIENIKYGFLKALEKPFKEKKLVKVLTQGEMTFIDHSEENNVILIGTSEGQIIEYDFVTAKLVKVTETKQNKLKSMKRSSMSGIIAIGSPMNMVHVIHPNDNHHQILDNAKNSELLEITPDGKFIFYKTDDNFVVKCGLDESHEKVIYDYEDEVKAFTISADATHLYVAGSKGVKIYTVNDGVYLGAIPYSQEELATIIQITPDNKYVALVSSDLSVKVFDLERNVQKVFRDVHTEKITCIAFSKDNRFLYSGSLDGALVVFDLEKKIILHKLEHFQQEGILGILVTEDGKNILTAAPQGYLKVSDISNSVGVHTLKHDFGPVTCLTNHQVGKELITGYKNGVIRIYNGCSGELLDTIKSDGIRPAEVTALNSSRNGHWLAAGFSDRTICIYNFDTKELHRTFSEVHPEAVTALAFTKDSKLVISCSSEASLKVWEVAKGTPDTPLTTIGTEHTDPIRDMVISKDGKYLVTASWDRSISVFRISRADVEIFTKFEVEQVYRFKDAHDGPVNSVAISGNNKYIVSVGSDLNAKIIDLERRSIHFTFKNVLPVPSRSVYYLLNDQYFATICEDGTLIIFNIICKEIAHKNQLPQKNVTDSTVIHVGENMAFATNPNQIHILTNPFVSKSIRIHCGTIPVTSYHGFCVIADFLSPKSSQKRRIEIIKNYSDLFIHPYEWNLLHITAIFYPQIELIEACIKAKINIVLDNSRLTPLHYLLHTNNHDITVFNYFLARFGEFMQASCDQYSIIASFSNYLPAIIKCGSFQAANFLKYAVLKPQSFAEDDTACFGSIGDGESRFLVANSTALKPDIRKSLQGEEGDQMLSIKVLGFNFNYGAMSKDMLKFMIFLDDVEDEEIFKVQSIRMIVEYMWIQNKQFFYYVAFFYSLFMILVSVYAGLEYDSRVRGHEIAILVSGCVLIFYEFLLAMLEGWLYFKDVWNFTDVTVHFLMIALPITVWNTGNGSVASQSVLTVLLFFGYSRWLSYFIVIDQTRRLIKIIQEVIKDMASFIGILVLVTFGFTFIFLQYNMGENKSSFGVELYNTYSLFFGNVNETYGTAQMVYFFLFSVFVSIVMLNLLIALINETFARISSSTDYHESKAKIGLVIEAITAKRFFIKIMIPYLRFKNSRPMRAFRRAFTGRDEIFTFNQLYKKKRSGYLYITKEITKEEYDELMVERMQRMEDAATVADEKARKHEVENLKAAMKIILKEELGITNQVEEGEVVRNEICNRKNKLNSRIVRLEEKMDLILDKLSTMQSSGGQSRKESQYIEPLSFKTFG